MITAFGAVQSVCGTELPIRNVSLHGEFRRISGPGVPIGHLVRLVGSKVANIKSSVT
jgi:hypothetical protein